MLTSHLLPEAAFRALAEGAADACWGSRGRIEERQALDPGLSVALVLQGAQQVVGHGADMTVRTARGDDEPIGHRAFTFQVDENNVLGLVVIETGQDHLLQPPTPVMPSNFRLTTHGVFLSNCTIHCLAASRAMRIIDTITKTTAARIKATRK